MNCGGGVLKVSGVLVGMLMIVSVHKISPLPPPPYFDYFYSLFFLHRLASLMCILPSRYQLIRSFLLLGYEWGLVLVMCSTIYLSILASFP
ncbi:hypothetical protein B0H11DRAFT_848087 [Mycena galericulata]|nr:hypothetical protein B0H11DRAFT_848087 [Mycena galericulata]